jgi:hypothetical protein
MPLALTVHYSWAHLVKWEGVGPSEVLVIGRNAAGKMGPNRVAQRRRGREGRHLGG